MYFGVCSAHSSGCEFHLLFNDQPTRQALLLMAVIRLVSKITNLGLSRECVELDARAGGRTNQCAYFSKQR